MQEQDIIKLLYKKYDSHKYCLSNSYIFGNGWECDFFSITNSKYSQEIEIKTSYSDFKADFKKTNKHLILGHKFNNKSYFLKKGSVVYEIEYEDGKTKLDENNRRIINDNSKTPFDRYLQEPSGKVRKRTCSDISYYKDKNNISIFNLKYRKIYSNITITDVSECIVPNKFMYVCPTDIIPLEEVPEYAGLIYVNENGRFKVIKKAPFIHKDFQEEKLRKILLEKFYWLSLNQQRDINILKRLINDK
jgi:hypothetical protein